MSVCVLAFISHVLHVTAHGLETAPDCDCVADHASVHRPLHFSVFHEFQVQQELANENILSRFLNEPAKIEQVKDIFTGLYSLDLVREG